MKKHRPERVCLPGDYIACAALSFGWNRPSSSIWPWVRMADARCITAFGELVEEDPANA